MSPGTRGDLSMRWNLFNVVRVLRIIREREKCSFLMHCPHDADTAGIMIAIWMDESIGDSATFKNRISALELCVRTLSMLTFIR
jgi:acetolactate synthase regulatory subunit